MAGDGTTRQRVAHDRAELITTYYYAARDALVRISDLLNDLSEQPDDDNIDVAYAITYTDRTDDTGKPMPWIDYQDTKQLLIDAGYVWRQMDELIDRASDVPSYFEAP